MVYIVLFTEVLFRLQQYYMCLNHSIALPQSARKCYSRFTLGERKIQRCSCYNASAPKQKTQISNLGRLILRLAF